MEADSRIGDARELLARIVEAVTGKGFSNPEIVIDLPFPYLGTKAPSRFLLDENRCIRFMGRTGYANLREKVLQLGRAIDDRRRLRGLPPLDELPLPKRAAFDSVELALWGTLGSGKSYMLTALTCDLLSFFKGSVVDGLQRRRVVYLPDSGEILEDLQKYSASQGVQPVQNALFLSYADEEEALHRILKISDISSAISFFEEEAKRGVRIYLIVDQKNALEEHKEDSPAALALKAHADSFIKSLSVTDKHMLVIGASANSTNTAKWYSKQITTTLVFHHGGLDDEEYKHWKQHFQVTFPITKKEDNQGDMELKDEDQELEEGVQELEDNDEELMIKDATGCVPLFLQCWSCLPAGTPPAAPWHKFITLNEIATAKTDLKEFMEDQLKNEAHMQTRLQMYLGFLSQQQVYARPQHYDCRYLYIDADRIGRCVCGIYRGLIGEVLQKFRKSCLVKRQWQQAISHELAKRKPNRSLLGFLIEQEMISEILESGIPLHARRIMQCTDIVYFDSGTEATYPILEGCVLYVSSVFNYDRVDAVVRELRKVQTSGKDPPPEQLDLLNKYNKLPLHVAGIQVTLGRLKSHKHSEDEFCTPTVMEVWYPGWDRNNVARYFIWYVLQAEIEKERSDQKELLPRVYGISEIKGKTRSEKVQGLEHASLYYPLEQFEPQLEKLKPR